MDDWLSLPGDPPPVVAAKKKKIRNTAVVEAPAREGVPVVLEPPEVSEQALELAKQKSEAREAFTRAWSKLRPRQKVFLRALQQTGFSVSRAAKIASELPSNFGTFNVKTAHRWARADENYKYILAAMKAEAAQQVTSREDLLLRAHRIAEIAEEGDEVYGADKVNGGYKVIGYERKLDTALRANEQLMKATKVIGSGEQNNANNSGNGPALVIQVVQKDGGVIDVTPDHVTIDLPRPDGA